MKLTFKYCFAFVFLGFFMCSCSEDDSYYKTPVANPNLQVELSNDTIDYRGSFEIFISSDLRLYEGDHYDVIFDGNLFPVRRTPTSIEYLEGSLVDTIEIGSRYTRTAGDYKIIVKAISYGTDEIVIETDSSNVVTVKDR